MLICLSVFNVDNSNVCHLKLIWTYQRSWVLFWMHIFILLWLLFCMVAHLYSLVAITQLPRLSFFPVVQIYNISCNSYIKLNNYLSWKETCVKLFLWQISGGLVHIKKKSPMQMWPILLQMWKIPSLHPVGSEKNVFIITNSWKKIIYHFKETLSNSSFRPK